MSETATRGNGIGWAVKELQAGHRVGRSGWNGKGLWLVLIHGSTWNMDREIDLKLSSSGGRENGYEWRSDFVAMRAVGGGLVPWLCSQTDLLATDWEVATA
jgi:hypothetical protein